MKVCHHCEERKRQGLCIRWGCTPDCNPCVLPYDHLGHCQSGDGVTGLAIAATFLEAR